MSFSLHPRLEADTVVVGELPLSLLLLSKDANYPWCILVPKREDVGEIYELEEEDQIQLLWESSLVGQTLMALFEGDKLNVATLGNMVPQLHFHHVVRYQNDIAWPGPIWGAQPAASYEPTELEARVELLRNALKEEFINLND